jgi:hypothetical protein
MLDKLFSYVNIFPMPLWLAMMFAPDHPITRRASRSSTILGIAALNYIITLVVSIRRMREENAEGGTFLTLDGVNTLISTRSGTLASWAHMIALDLFTGAWIYRQCQRLAAPAWVRISSLFGTLMAGPGGLLFFLGWRLWAAREGEALADGE